MQTWNIPSSHPKYSSYHKKISCILAFDIIYLALLCNIIYLATGIYSSLSLAKISNKPKLL